MKRFLKITATVVAVVLAAGFGTRFDPDNPKQLVSVGGKPIVWQQAQIHPYEPAAGESALVMIQELCGQYGEDILDKIDVVMIPRINVEGAFLFVRTDYDGIDMNRDHMAINSKETAMLHETYYLSLIHI